MFFLQLVHDHVGFVDHDEQLVVVHEKICVEHCPACFCVCEDDLSGQCFLHVMLNLSLRVADLLVNLISESLSNLLSFVVIR